MYDYQPKSGELVPINYFSPRVPEILWPTRLNASLFVITHL